MIAIPANHINDILIQVALMLEVPFELQVPILDIMDPMLSHFQFTYFLKWVSVWVESSKQNHLVLNQSRADAFHSNLKIIFLPAYLSLVLFCAVSPNCIHTFPIFTFSADHKNIFVLVWNCSRFAKLLGRRSPFDSLQRVLNVKSLSVARYIVIFIFSAKSKQSLTFKRSEYAFSRCT